MQEPTCMWAPASSSARKEASRPVRRSGLDIAGDCPPSDPRDKDSTEMITNLQQRVQCSAWQWTSLIHRPSERSSRRTSGASTPPPCGSSATRRRRRTSCRTCSCAGRASDRLTVVVSGEEGRVEDQPAAVLERDDTRETVREALRLLPEPQREALVL